MCKLSVDINPQHLSVISAGVFITRTSTYAKVHGSMIWAAGVALLSPVSDVPEGKTELEKTITVTPASDPRYKQLLKRQWDFLEKEMEIQKLQSSISRYSQERTAIQNNTGICNFFFYHSQLHNKSIQKGCK